MTVTLLLFSLTYKDKLGMFILCARGYYMVSMLTVVLMGWLKKLTLW